MKMGAAPPSGGERRYMRGGGTGQAFQTVATFQHRYHAASGEFHDGAGDIGEILVGEGETAERVAQARIEAGGDQHQIGAEASRGGHQRSLDRAEDLFAAGAGRKREVHGGPLPGANARLIRSAEHTSELQSPMYL